MAQFLKFKQEVESLRQSGEDSKSVEQTVEDSNSEQESSKDLTQFVKDFKQVVEDFESEDVRRFAEDSKKDAIYIPAPKNKRVEPPFSFNNLRTGKEIKRMLCTLPPDDFPTEKDKDKEEK